MVPQPVSVIESCARGNQKTGRHSERFLSLNCRFQVVFAGEIMNSRTKHHSCSRHCLRLRNILKRHSRTSSIAITALAIDGECPPNSWRATLASHSPSAFVNGSHIGVDTVICMCKYTQDSILKYHGYKINVCKDLCCWVFYPCYCFLHSHQ